MTVATVKFTTVGRVLPGGKITIEMPHLVAEQGLQHGWSFESPNVTFTTATGVVPTASASFAARTLTITTVSAALSQATAYSLRITGVRTPSSAVPHGNAQVNTRDAVDKDIDRSSSCQTNQINSGALSASLNLATRAPGYRSVATLPFTTVGRVPVGGFVKITLPDIGGFVQSGWKWERGSPFVLFAKPSTGVAPTADGPTLSDGDRTLTFKIATRELAEATQYTLSISWLRSPSSEITGESNAVMSTQDSTGKQIDVTTACRLETIVTGAIANATFATDTDTPGFKSSATVTFTTAGQVLVGGKIKIVMPDLQDGTALQSGWDFDASPAIAFTVPSGAGAPTASATFSKSTRTLTLTTAGATLGQGTQFAFRIAGVRTPSSVVGASNVELTTLDSRGNKIALATNCGTDAIGIGALSGATFTLTEPSAGLKSSATVTFTTAGRVLVGGKIKLTMPDLQDGTLLQSGWGFESPSVTFTTPSGTNKPTASATFAASTRTLTLTTTNSALDQGAQFAFTLTGVRAPSSAVGSNSAVMTTQDSKDKNIDRTEACGINAVLAGALANAKFSTMRDTPGILTMAQLTFTTVGKVLVGGQIKIVMPKLSVQSGWHFNSPAVVCDFPASNKPIVDCSGVDNCLVNDTTRSLTFKLKAHEMAEQATYTFNVSNLTVRLTGRVMQGGVVSIVMPAVAGVQSAWAFEPANSLSIRLGKIQVQMATGWMFVGGPAVVFEAPVSGAPTVANINAAGNTLVVTIGSTVNISTPSAAVSAVNVTVAFTTAGQVLIGGKIELTLPDVSADVQSGWAFEDAVPTVTFTKPSTNTPTATAVKTGRVLAITLVGHPLSHGAVVEFKINNVRTPSAVVAQTSTALKTMDGTGKVIGITAACAVSEIAVGKFLLATLASQANTPGVTSTSTVAFTTAGQVLIGGKIELTLPDVSADVQSGWAFEDAVPTVTFTKPSTNTPTATAVKTGRVLTITLTGANALKQGTAHAFSISNVRTPSGIVVATNTTLQAVDNQGKAIADTSTCGVGAIVSGALPSASFEPLVNSPGITSTGTVNFTATGIVPVGGKIELTLPDVSADVQSGWAFEDAVPTVTFTKPSTNTPTATAVKTGRVLTITLTGANALKQGANVVFTISNVSTPSAAVPSNNLSLKTVDNTGRTIDATDQCRVRDIAAGGLLNAALTPKVMSPGVTSTSTVAFTTAGQVLIGGKIELTLPDVSADVQSGWAFEDAVPTVTFTKPSTNTPTATAVKTGRVLTITLTGANALKQGANVVFAISNVSTPSAAVPSNNLSLKTIDSKSKAIAATDACSVNEISAGSLLTATFSPEANTPGVNTDSKVTFTSLGQVPVGGKIELALPNVTAGVQSGWAFEDAVPTVKFTKPSTKTPTAIAVKAGRILTITLGGHPLTQGANVALTISNVRTPSAAVPANSLDSQNKTIATTANCVVGAIAAGVLESAFLTVASATPGFASVATVSFRTTGRVQSAAAVFNRGNRTLRFELTGTLLQGTDQVVSISRVQIGGRFEIEMPAKALLAGGDKVQSGWELTQPGVSIVGGSFQVSNVQYNKDTLTLALNLSGAVPLNAGERITLAVTNMRTPSSVSLAAAVKLRTRDPKGGIVDGPTDVGENGICCASGVFDTCGVCDGDDSSCDISLPLTVEAGATDASIIAALIAQLGVSADSISLTAARRLSEAQRRKLATRTVTVKIVSTKNTGKPVNANQVSATLSAAKDNAAAATVLSAVTAPGYWRASKTTASFHRCAADAPGRCKGGSINGTRDSQCAAGYAGARCTACDTSNGYARQLGGSCARCSSNPLGKKVPWRLIVGVALVLVMLATCVAAKKSAVSARLRARMSKFYILLSFVQVVTRMRGAYQLRLPHSVDRLLVALSVLEFVDIPGLVSLIPCISDTPASFVERVHIQAAIALGCTLLLLAALKAAPLRNAAAVLTFLLYPGIASTLVSAFQCTSKLEDGKAYLLTDGSLDCNDIDGTLALATAALVVVVAGIPLLYGALLFQHRAALCPELDARHILQPGPDRDVLTMMGYRVWAQAQREHDPELASFSFLWHTFSPDCFWYAPAELLRKLVVVVMPLVMAHDADLLVFGLLVTGLSAAAHVALCPYMSRADQALASLAHAATFVMLVAGQATSTVAASVVLWATVPPLLLLLLGVACPTLVDRMVAREAARMADRLEPFCTPALLALVAAKANKGSSPAKARWQAQSAADWPQMQRAVLSHVPTDPGTKARAAADPTKFLELLGGCLADT
eukprot:g409.t1